MTTEKYERLDVDRDVALQIKWNYEQGFEIFSNLSKSQVYLLACTTVRIIDGEIKRLSEITHCPHCGRRLSGEP